MSNINVFLFIVLKMKNPGDIAIALLNFLTGPIHLWTVVYLSRTTDLTPF